MKKNSITEFELEEKDSKLRLKRGVNGTPHTPPPEESGFIGLPAVLPTLAPPSLAVAPPPTNNGEADIKSPMIGTFYRSPSPEAAPYVEIGTEVNPDTVVCIIEAMKVMNEIKAELKGTITQALVENGKPVEFGQPLFRIRPT